MGKNSPSSNHDFNRHRNHLRGDIVHGTLNKQERNKIVKKEVLETIKKIENKHDLNIILDIKEKLCKTGFLQSFLFIGTNLN